MVTDAFTRTPAILRTRACLVGVMALSWGCASPFQGKWKGECDVGVGSNRINMPLTIDLVGSKGTTVRGIGTFGYNGVEFEGEARGRVVDDETLLLDIVGVYGGYTITVEIDGTFDGEEVEGLCAYQDQETLYEGDVLLAIVGD